MTSTIPSDPITADELRALRAWRHIAHNHGVQIFPYCATGQRGAVRIELGGQVFTGYAPNNDLNAAAIDVARQIGFERVDRVCGTCGGSRVVATVDIGGSVTGDEECPDCEDEEEP